MKFRNLILSGALALGIVAAGCNENPTTPPGGGTVTGIQASSKTSTSVGLQWTAFSGATAYNVSWVAVTAGAGSGSLNNVAGTSTTVTGLTANATYDFTITAVGADGSGTIRWAGADRFTQTTNNESIRMYEKASTEESGVNLFDGTGPRNVSLVAGRPGRAQLAMYLTPENGGTPNKIIIGPVYAITEYKVAAASDPLKVDQNVFISGTTYTGITSLDTWYLSANLETLIDQASNVKAYEFTTSTQTGQGFIVRTGTAGNFNYARVLIKSIGGQILQGAFPNRYVELEVSYQKAVGVPYAKGRVAPPGVRATGGH